MRKTAIVLMLVLFTMLFVACKVEVDDLDSGLVSVVFTSDTAGKGLFRSIEDCEPSTLYWTYTAEKIDGTGLNTGARKEQTPLKGDGTVGFNGEALTLSQGKWRFTLYGYKSNETVDGNVEYKEKVYQGSDDVKLVKIQGVDTQMISINVSAVDDGGEGTLCISENLAVQGSEGVFDRSSIEGVKEVITVKLNGEGNELWTADSYSSRIVSLDPGSYRITVSYVDSTDENMVYASGSITATVYSNLTTTVSGILNESSINANIYIKDVKRTASIVIDGSGTYTFDGTPANLESTTDKTTITGTFDAEDGQKLNVTMYSTLGANSKFKVSDDSGTVFAGFDLSLDDGATISGNTIVKVSTMISQELGENILISHVKTDGSTETMTKVPTVEEVDSNGEFWYDSETGSLVFATSSFSSFVVSCYADITVVIGNEIYAFYTKDYESEVAEWNNGTYKIQTSVEENKYLLFSNRDYNSAYIALYHAFQKASRGLGSVETIVTLNKDLEAKGLHCCGVFSSNDSVFVDGNNEKLGFVSDIPTVALDLHGHSINMLTPAAFGYAISVYNANLFIIDSSAQQNGMISSEQLFTVMHQGNGKVVVESGSVVSKNCYRSTTPGGTENPTLYYYSGVSVATATENVYDSSSDEYVSGSAFFNGGTLSFDCLAGCTLEGSGNISEKVVNAKKFENPTLVRDCYAYKSAVDKTKFAEYLDIPAGIFAYLSNGLIPDWCTFSLNGNGTFTVVKK